MYIETNQNPDGKRVGDCTIRAISAATLQDWESVYAALALEGFIQHDLMSANYVWGSYLRRCGWTRSAIPNICPFCQPPQKKKSVICHAIEPRVTALLYPGRYYTGRIFLFFFGVKR